MTSLKRLADHSTDPESRRKVLLRCGIALLYAHWEGFIKTAAAAYVEYVARRKLPYQDLAANFVAIGIRDSLTRAVHSKKAKDHNELVNFFRTKLSDPSSIGFDAAVSADSNLTSAVLQNIIEMLGFDYTFYETKAHLIDEGLVKQRNSIAHGDYLAIDLDGFKSLHDDVLSMMECFRDQVDNYATQKLYSVVKPPSPLALTLGRRFHPEPDLLMNRLLSATRQQRAVFKNLTFVQGSTASLPTSGACLGVRAIPSSPASRS